MDWRRNVVYAIIIIPLTVIILIIINSVLPSLGQMVSYVITAALGPFVAGFLLYVIKPFLDPWLVQFTGSINSKDTVSSKPEPIRILMFGASRTGKSTFIQTAINNTYNPDALPSTTNFHVIETTASITRGNQTDAYPIKLADYRGQYPSQFVKYPPEDFFGSRYGRKRVNAVIFMVDLFPEIDYEGSPLTKDSAVKARIEETYRDDALQKIRERVSRNKFYVTEEWTQTVLSITTSPDYRDSLCVVCLIINKMDLLEYVISLGYLESEGIEDAESFVANLYHDTIQMVETFVDKTPGIDFFVYHAINSKSQEARMVYNEIIDKVIQCGRM